MSKYIVEIKPEYEDSFKGLMILGAKDSNLFVDTLAVENLEELNSDYINEHYGDLQDDAYNKGYAQCQDDYSDALKHAKDTAYKKGLHDGESKCGYCNEYQRGLDDAWEAARKLFSSMADSDIEKAFPTEWNNGGFKALMNLQPQEAIEKLKAYEEKQKADDKIKVGDEVEVLNSGSKYLIAWFAGTSICGFSHDGVTCHLQPSDVRKTGRHFDIAKILEAMRND